MSPEMRIRQLAAETADGLHHQSEALHRELGEIRTRQAQIGLKLDAAKLAQQRLANFQIVIGEEYQCPRCWIERATHASLRPMDGSTDSEDFFRCSGCGWDISLPSH